VPVDELEPLGNLCDFRQQIAVANRNHRPWITLTPQGLVES
jgi:hypothetical protein